MTAYLDAGFLLTLLLRTDQTREANAVLKRFEGPFTLTFLHQLQAENLLLQKTKSKDNLDRMAGQAGRNLWNYYFAEGVFRLGAVDWVSAFTLAITWTQHAKSTPPLPLLILHPALAVNLNATHFLSFDPRSRIVAKAAGLKVLPEAL